MKCPFCLSTDPKYFEEGVCRRCLAYRNGAISDASTDIRNPNYLLPFELTYYQSKIVSIICECRENVFLEAVCGAGKTEICLQIVQEYLRNGKRVGWAIPRRQVVLELRERLSMYFAGAKVVAVCQGYTDDVEGDLIICTTHQLYRYHCYFDLLIVDEPDAYPFFGNELLYGFMKTSVRMQIVFISATMDEQLFSLITPGWHLTMPMRPDLKPLPIPHVFLSLFKFLKRLYQLKEEKCIIYVPTINDAHRLSVISNIPMLTSKTEDKEEALELFTRNPKGKIIATTILERGVTFENVNVFVMKANHSVFTAASLIQIAGRVRRGVNSKKGECVFYANEKSKNIERCLNYLERMNQLAAPVFQKEKMGETLLDGFWEIAYVENAEV